MKARHQSLIVVVGETAAGKSALALRLAKEFNGEIISADSRTVYRGMDIGTAKPTKEEMAAVPHHLIDIVNPDENFTVADFKKQAIQAIEDIASRGKLPIMVGGTGLYVDSVLYDYNFRYPAASPARENLNKKSVDELQLMIMRRGLELPNNPKNPRHLIRVLETDGLQAHKKELRKHTLVLGLAPERDELKRQIEKRTNAMLEAGLVDEIKQLADRFGWDVEPLQAPAYKAFRGYIEGAETLAEAKEKLIKNDLALAKRQRTWFKRNKSIHWLSTPVKWQSVVDQVTTFLES